MLKHLKHNFIYNNNIKNKQKITLKISMKEKIFNFETIFCLTFNINSKILFNFWKKTLLFLIKKSFFFFQKKGKIKTLNKLMRKYLINKTFIDLLINFWNKIYFYFNFFEVVKMQNQINIHYIKPLYKAKVYKKALMFWILLDFFKQNKLQPQKKKRKSLFYTFNLFFNENNKNQNKDILINKNILIKFLS